MGIRKRNRRKFDEDPVPTKEDYAVAQFLHSNVQTREAKLHNNDVRCFVASAAVDALMTSRWCSAKNDKSPLFHSRSSCVNFCESLMQKNLFHRAEKVQRKEKADLAKRKASEFEEKDIGQVADELRERRGRRKGKKGTNQVADAKSADLKTPTDVVVADLLKEGKRCDKEDKDEVKKKKEKRLKLVMSDDQRFMDSGNIYVWIYDPVKPKTLIVGSLIVLGAIGLCLFPLWPEVVRIGVYYISLMAAGFVGFILALVVLRFTFFCLIWTLTLGRHHFWLLPNLTEDVGFFESFRPAYKHEWVVKPGAETPKTKDAECASTCVKEGSISAGEGDEGGEQEFDNLEKVEFDKGATEEVGDAQVEDVDREEKNEGDENSALGGGVETSDDVRVTAAPSPD